MKNLIKKSPRLLNAVLFVCNHVVSVMLAFLKRIMLFMIDIRSLDSETFLKNLVKDYDKCLDECSEKVISKFSNPKSKSYIRRSINSISPVSFSGGTFKKSTIHLPEDEVYVSLNEEFHKTHKDVIENIIKKYDFPELLNEDVDKNESFCEEGDCSCRDGYSYEDDSVLIEVEDESEFKKEPDPFPVTESNPSFFVEARPDMFPSSPDFKYILDSSKESVPVSTDMTSQVKAESPSPESLSAIFGSIKDALNEHSKLDSSPLVKKVVKKNQSKKSSSKKSVKKVTNKKKSSK